MKADYDTQAEALSIELSDVPRWDGSEEIDDTYCHVSTFRGRPANIELLNPSEHLDLLDRVASRFDIDPAVLRAAAQAALAAPDRTVTLEVASPAIV
jgi:uncharacterized protein YuzE